MIYRFGIATAANTPKISRKVTDLKLTAGIIHQIDIVFPSGCAALAHIQILDGLYQVWPSNPAEDFAGDGTTISFKEFYELRTGPRVLTAYTWNLDDTYPHTIIVRLGLLQQSQIQGVWLPWSAELYEELEF